MQQGVTTTPYTTLAPTAALGAWQETQTVLGSQFLAFGCRADSPEQAFALLSELRAAHPQASHHVWAYQIGTLQRFSDDGEPSGTAGAPVLRAIKGQKLDHVMVVVVRYFGGTKLGTGGLARAYGGAAAELLRRATREEVLPHTAFEVSVPFEHVGALYALLERQPCQKGIERYSERGLHLRLALPTAQAEDFLQALKEATRGASAAEPQDPEQGGPLNNKAEPQ